MGGQSVRTVGSHEKLQGRGRSGGSASVRVAGWAVGIWCTVGFRVARGNQASWPPAPAVTKGRSKASPPPPRPLLGSSRFKALRRGLTPSLPDCLMAVPTPVPAAMVSVASEATLQPAIWGRGGREACSVGSWAGSTRSQRTVL